MIKSTMKELKKEAQFFSKDELVNYLKESGLKVGLMYGKYPNVKKIAYCESMYGCGGYLLSYTLESGSQLLAFTGRSSWMYTCNNSDDLPSDVLSKWGPKDVKNN